jgi:mRNA interferase RelE/StbE
VPRSPSTLRLLPPVRDDLAEIQAHNPDHAERVLRKINDWQEKIKWGRVPQEHLKYLTGSQKHNFYRERVGNSGYRVIYEISGDVMTAVAALPKGDDTYDLDELRGRVEEHQDEN